MSNVVDEIFESPVFQTERMVISRWHPELARQAYRIYGDPEVAQWIGGVAETSLDSMRCKINELIERNENWPDCWGSWPAFLKTSRELIGAMLMKPMPDAEGRFTDDIEIGWHLARNHWGYGFATEGGQKMIDIAFNELNIPELSAVTEPTNVRSQNVALRLGLKHVGQTDSYYGQTLDLFKISNPNW